MIRKFSLKGFLKDVINMLYEDFKSLELARMIKTPKIVISIDEVKFTIFVFVIDEIAFIQLRVSSNTKFLQLNAMMKPTAAAIASLNCLANSLLNLTFI